MNHIVKATAASLLLLASITACSMFKRPVSLNTSSDIPAAKGGVKFAKTDNGNTSIDVTLELFSRPSEAPAPREHLRGLGSCG